ncbi:T9SS type A sorting domain-containing protein [Candidatus Poribacteria bacterium]|nr:T9SS type A sorting domain-containing protein [Candidatus Poribacteria bacterium]
MDTLTPTLKWQASLNATSYGVQIAKDKKFAAIAFEQASIKTTEFQIPAGKLAGGTYYWRVNATGVTSTGEWSEARSMSLNAPNRVIAEPIAIQVTKTQLEVETKPPPPPEVQLPIQIQDVHKFYGFQLDVGFNPAILEVVQVTEGDFLKSIGGTTFWKPPTIDNKVGTVKGMLSARKDPGEVNGNGTLAVLHLRIKQPGSSPIEFSNIKLSNEAVEPLPATWVNSSVSYTLTVTPTPKPVASATIRAIPSVVNNEIVVSVRMENVNQLNGFSVVLRYPSSELELLEVKKGDFFTAELKQPSGNPMQLEAKKSDSKASVTGGGELVSLRFRIWEGGEMTFGLGQGSLTAPILLPSQKQGKVSTPTLENGRIMVVASPEWDVNKDYVVNIFDLVLLAQNFGKSITGTPRPNPDVARDGVVDVFDFVKVGINFGKQYSALPPAATPPLAREPMPVERTVPPSERASLLRVLSALESARHPDAEFRQVLELLRSLLGMSTPERTQLLSNFPNPFNPETWIPYQLARDAAVQITIYDIKGSLVHRLELGHQQAGYYRGRDSAAYWDGRNEAGELVSSGVYFYQLRAGDFTAVKRMVIRK